jgi:hypothetical protein
MSAQLLNARNGLSVGEVPIQAIDASNNHTVNNLTVNGTTSGIAVAAFPTGTRLTFQQTTAPTGWTKDTAITSDSVMRLVTGTVSNGGSQAFSTWNAQTATGAVTLTTANMPSHTHSITDPGHNHTQNAHTHTDSGHKHEIGMQQDPAVYPGNIYNPPIATTTLVFSSAGVNGHNTGGGGDGLSYNSTANLSSVTATNIANTTGITAAANGSGTSFTTPLSHGIFYYDFIIAVK